MHTQAKIFKNNTSQAVRLPKPVSFPEGVKTVDVITVGKGILLVPSEDSWDHWFDSLPDTSDFLEDREQPEDQERELF